MNSSFLSTLMAVLNDQQEILQLPNNKLVAYNIDGDPISKEIPISFVLKLARLQTLIDKADEDTPLPSFEETEQIAEATGGDFVSAMTNSMFANDDKLLRVMMLKRIIVEVVRDAYPAESEHFDVEYFAHINRSVVRRPTRTRQPFFDD